MSYLPNILRPRNGFYKRFIPGLDLPSWFYDSLKAIDNKLFIVYHPYRVLWDDIINEYEGELEDPRFTIHNEYGQENWGFVLTDRSGEPIKENKWHIWRLCDPYGWGHVVGVESHEGEYLNLLLERLHLQAIWSDKYGALSWNRKLDADAQEEREKQQQAKEAMYDAYNKENAWLTKKAMENFESGRVAPTNPTIDRIMSYPGQTNRSRIVRPLDDEEGGLTVPGE